MMDGNCFKPASSFLLNKCAMTTGGGDDRISTLPDKILLVILSFLSLREAASTSVLSSRWLDLWKYTRDLNFSKDIIKFDINARVQMSWVKEVLKSWDVEKCKYVELVNSVLQLHKAPSVKQFSISFYVDKTAQLKVAKWLEFVSLKGVERLELDFKCQDPNYQVVLEELLRGLRQTDHVNVIFFQSLKSLRLNWLVVSGEAIKMLLRNCPLLEALIISCATLTSDIEVCGSGATLKLKRLQIYCCRGNKSIIVSAPSLISLMVDDTSGKLLLKNVPELVEADIGFGHENLYEVRQLASAIFCFGSQLKTLNLTLEHPEIFLVDGVFPQMPNLNKLDVVYSGVKMQSLLPVTALVWACPRLEEFKFMLMQLYNDNIRGAPVQVVRDVERSPHRHLKLFDLAGFKDGDVHCIELANYILDNCVVLQKIIIRPMPSIVPSIEAFDSKNQFEDGMMQDAVETFDSKNQFEDEMMQDAVEAFDLKNQFEDEMQAAIEAFDSKNQFEDEMQAAIEAFEDEMQAAIDYAKQQLQGKIPQHIQLAILK